MNVLVLGNAGYIGSILEDKLLFRGHRVTGVDWGVFGLRPMRPGFVQLRADTRELDESYFEGIDAVIDLAAISNDPAGELDPGITWSINRDARRRNAALANKVGVYRYVLASSCSVYGASDGDLLTERSPVNPLTTYAKAAVEAEQEVRAQNGDMSVIVLRQGTVYGYSPRMRWDLVVNAFVRDLYARSSVTIEGEGNQWRPLLYVEDAVKVMAHILEIEISKTAGQIFNVVGQNIQIRELADDLAEQLSGTVEYQPGETDRRSYRVDGTKLKWTLWRYPGVHICEAAGDLWDKLEAGEIDPRLPSTVEVYRKYFESAREQASA